ncbi:MAG: substrate-binding domain-containing protein [Planctomycetota bacterium]
MGRWGETLVLALIFVGTIYGAAVALCDDCPDGPVAEARSSGVGDLDSEFGSVDGDAQSSAGAESIGPSPIADVGIDGSGLRAEWRSEEERRAEKIAEGALCIAATDYALSAIDVQEFENVLRLAGHEVVWESGSTEEVIQLLRLGGADFGLTSAFPGRRTQPQDILSESIGCHILAVLRHPSVDIASIQSRQMRRVLDGRYRDWSQLGLEEQPISVSWSEQSAIRRAVYRLLGSSHMTGRVTHAGAGVVNHVATHEGAIGLVELRLLEQGGFAVDPELLVVAIDGVRPSLASFEGGRYPVGRWFQLARATDADPEIVRLFDELTAPRSRERIAPALLEP